MINVHHANDIDIVDVMYGGMSRIRPGQERILVRVLRLLIGLQLFAYFFMCGFRRGDSVSVRFQGAHIPAKIT
jgi:hypothetical protein